MEYYFLFLYIILPFIDIGIRLYFDSVFSLSGRHNKKLRILYWSINRKESVILLLYLSQLVLETESVIISCVAQRRRVSLRRLEKTSSSTYQTVQPRQTKVTFSNFESASSSIKNLSSHSMQDGHIMFSWLQRTYSFVFDVFASLYSILISE